MGLYAKTAPIELMIAVWPWGAYLGEEGKQQGIRAISTELERRRLEVGRGTDLDREAQVLASGSLSSDESAGRRSSKSGSRRTAALEQRSQEMRDDVR